MLEGESDSGTWELSKENILPLKQGRKANVLSVALDESAMRKLNSVKHEFEEELRTYSGDDPLDVWYRYSLWVEQNYPKGGKDGNLKKLIEKCVASIHVNTETNEKYKNDARLLALWVRYANLCPNPLDIYLALEGKAMFVGLAEYYISWSWEFEKLSNFRRAESIYQKGIQAGAAPFDVLQDAYKKFQTRVARATIEGSVTEPETDSADPHRVALTALKVKGRKNRVANERVGSNVLGPAGRVSSTQPSSNAGGPAFNIYQDNGSVAASTAGVPTQGGSLPVRSTIHKENVKDPVQWTKVKVGQKTTGVVSVEDINKHQKPAFSFHQDEDTPQHGKTPSKLPETSNVLSVRKKEFDEWQIPLFIAEPSDPKVQPQYCKHKVYCGNEEFSFEELRAAAEFKKEKEEKKRKDEEEKNSQIQQMQAMLKKQEEMIQQLLQSQITQKSEERQQQQNRDRSNYHDSWICMNKSVTASINASVNVSNFLDESSTRALLQLKPATLTPVSLEPLAEQDHGASAPVTNVSGQDSSNASHSNSRGLNLTDPTVNTKIAMNAINDMWSASLFKDDTIATSGDVNDASAPKESAPFTIYQDNTSSKQQESVTQKPAPQPFTIFCDNGQNNQEEVKPSSPFTIFQDEPEGASSADPNDLYPQNQDENRPPEGLKPNKEIRPLAGVLQLATNVPFTPLEDQKMEDDDGTNKGDDGTNQRDDGANKRNDGSNKEELNYDDDFEGIFPLNGTGLADFTLKMPNNPEAFAKFAKVVSTPASWSVGQVQQPKVTESDCTLGLLKGGSHFPLVEENVEEEEEKKEQVSGELMPPPTVQPLPATPPETGTKQGLSPIMEASREYRSSSSSSGYSTTCTTLGTNSTQCGAFSTTQTSRSRHNSHTQVESVLDTDGNCQTGDFTKSGYLADKSRGESLAESRQNNATSQNHILNKEEEPTFDARQAAAMLSELYGTPMESAPARVDYREPKEYSLSREPKECGSNRLSKFKFPEKINPFEEQLLAKLLSGLEEKLESRGGFVQMSGKLPVLKPNMQLSLGREMFHVRRLRGEGAYAKVYQAATVDPMNVTIFPTGDDDDDDEEEEDDELQMILKVQKPACQWEFYICHELRQRLKAKSYPVNMLDSVMRINRGYFYPNGSILVNQYHKYGTLLDVVNGYKKAGQVLPEEIIVFFMIEVISIIEALHKCRIIHADVKPDNFLVRDVPSINISATTPEEMFESSPDSLKLIDFGRSIDMELLPEGTTFTEKVTTEGFTCCEMMDGRPWTYQTDLYGIAAIAYCFLFGSYMEVKKGPSGKWELKGVTMKRYWKKDLWQSVFSTLLNVPSCSALPSLSKLKQEMMTKFFESRMQKEINVQFKWLTSILIQKK